MDDKIKGIGSCPSEAISNAHDAILEQALNGYEIGEWGVVQKASFWEVVVTFKRKKEPVTE